jgi:hypothetical protein
VLLVEMNREGVTHCGQKVRRILAGGNRCRNPRWSRPAILQLLNS